MGIIIGIDIGGSTTKIAGYTADQKLQGFLKVLAEDQITCLYGALGRYLHEQKLGLKDVSQIILTGVGASFIEEDIYGIPTKKTPELQAIGKGGLMLSGLNEALVVSMGTGTAFVLASEQDILHVGGSGVGGGSLTGLSSCLLHERDISVVSRMAMKGCLEHIDLTIQDIFCGEAPSLPPELTASNFGKIKSGVSDADIAAALFNMVFQTIGMLAVFACQNRAVKDIVLTGALAELPQAATVFDMMSRIYQVRFIIPEHAAFATAIGAVSTAFSSPCLNPS